MDLTKSIAGVAFMAGIAFAQSSHLSKTDKLFLSSAADDEMTEAHLGQMAEARTEKSSIKDFAAKLDRDHTQAYASLTTLAAKEGTAVPKGIDIRRNKPVGELARLKGSKFNGEFLKVEIRENRAALALFKREAHYGRDAEVKAYASKQIPTLEGQLRTAEALMKSQKGG